MKFLHSAFVAAPALFRCGDVKLSSSMLFSSVSNFNVGGNKFTISDEDIQKHPSSLLLQLVKAAPINEGKKDEIDINRSGAMFKYIYAFLVNGQLPRNEEGYIALDEKTLTDLQKEAEFYRLQALLEDCRVQRKKSFDLETYMTIRMYLNKVKQRGIGSVEFQQNPYLGRILQSFRSPFCMKGTTHCYNSCKHPLFKSTTEASVNIEELIASASQSPFGRGTETVVDTDVRNSFEIEASQLNPDALADISERYEDEMKNLVPHLDLSLRPYKLVIYKEGGHFDAHRDTVRGDGHIGTLVVILNSTYTGGELEVTHGGRTEVVTGPYSWVAMYGDCLHKINPVTSGTRVSLIYDIYGTQPEGDENVEDDENNCSDEDEELDDKYSEWGNAPRPLRLDTSLDPDCEASDAKAMPPNEEQKMLLRGCLNNELVGYDSIVVCFEHLYPECQTHASFLKGSDRVLFDLLKENAEYDVEVVAATIYKSFHAEHYENRYEDEEDDEDYSYTACSLFSPTVVKRAMGILPKDGKTREKTKLIMTGELSDKTLLDYSPYIERTGNEAQLEESLYIVAGVQVRKKKA